MKKLNTTECNVLESSNTVFFDVDETLILWDTKERKGRKDFILVEDPHLNGMKVKVYPHYAHGNILRRNYHQGRIVVVWSAAGHLWAKAIVKALKLEKYVSLVMEKPVQYVDDVPMEFWKPKRIYLEIDTEIPNDEKD